MINCVRQWWLCFGRFSPLLSEMVVNEETLKTTGERRLKPTVLESMEFEV